MEPKVIKILKNDEDGTSATISHNYQKGFNVMMHDSDSGQLIGGKVGFSSYDIALAYAIKVLNFNVQTS